MRTCTQVVHNVPFLMKENLQYLSLINTSIVQITSKNFILLTGINTCGLVSPMIEQKNYSTIVTRQIKEKTWLRKYFNQSFN